MANEVFCMNVLDGLSELVFVILTDMTVAFANKTALLFNESSQSDVFGKPIWDLPMWKNDVDTQNELMFTCGHIFSKETAKRLSLMTTDDQGGVTELDFLISPVFEDNEVSKLVATGYNITELVKAKGSLTRNERQINALFKNSTQGYFFQMLPEAAIIPDEISHDFIDQVYEALRIEGVSTKVYEYLGIGETQQSDIDFIEALGITTDEKYQIWSDLLLRGISSISKELIRPLTDDRIFLELRFAAILMDEDKFEGNFCIINNITQRYIYERELNFLANKDPLTGLNNRRHFYRLTNELLLKALSAYTVAMFDIDKFKSINDTYGHDVGDIAIRKVADIIDSTISGDGVTGRYGGEEFIVIMPVAISEGMLVLENIRKKIESTSINFGNGSMHLTVSCGAHSLYQVSDEALNNAIIYADKALLEAKKTGRNKCVVYDDELHGLKALDKMTGVYTKNAFLYKQKQFHDALRKSDITYGVIGIQIHTLIINKLEILNQYLKQTAGSLHGILRERDVVGRFEDMTYLVLIDSIDEKILQNVKERIEQSVNKLSDKFDHLVNASVYGFAVTDWRLEAEDIFKQLFSRD